MSRRHRNYAIGTAMQKTPRRGEIWLAVDRDKKHNGREEEKVYKDSVQGGTRICIVVSNDTGNRHAPVVEVVYTTTRQKNELPTHFLADSTPEPSTVLCEQIMTVAKKDLTICYGALTANETSQLNKCLRVSLGL